MYVKYDTSFIEDLLRNMKYRQVIVKVYKREIEGAPWDHNSLVLFRPHGSPPGRKSNAHLIDKILLGDLFLASTLS